MVHMQLCPVKPINCATKAPIRGDQMVNLLKIHVEKREINLANTQFINKPIKLIKQLKKYIDQIEKLID